MSLRRLPVSLVPLIVGLLAAGCGDDATPTPTLPAFATSAPDLDALALHRMAQEAESLARQSIPDALLRQVDLAAPNDRHLFHLTDPTATRTVTVIADPPDAPSEEWQVLTPASSPLLGRADPGISLEALWVGPARVVAAASAQWTDCSLHNLSLSGTSDSLVWYVFCDLLAGTVSGTVDGKSGAFTPSAAPPPAVQPLTAVPQQ